LFFGVLKVIKGRNYKKKKHPPLLLFMGFILVFWGKKELKKALFFFPENSV